MADTSNMNIVLQHKANEFIKECEKAGIKVAITQGFRSIVYQNELYAQGRSKPGKIVTNLKGGYSPHNYGLAFDFCIYHNGKIDWNASNPKWTQAGKIGEKLGLEWGGRWTGFLDMPHLQYMFGMDIKQLINGEKPPKVKKISSIEALRELIKTKKITEKDIIRVGQTIFVKI